MFIIINTIFEEMKKYSFSPAAIIAINPFKTHSGENCAFGVLMYSCDLRHVLYITKGICSPSLITYELKCIPFLTHRV